MRFYHSTTMGWLEKLQSGGVLVIDGGTGSELRRRGAPWGDATWSGLAGAARHDLLVNIHMDYIAAGAEVIIANTFGTARFVLESVGFGEHFKMINRDALAAAFEARERSGMDVAVAGSISCLPPGFDHEAYPDPGRERADYQELVDLFDAEGVDLIALEMLQDDRHAALACDAVRASGLPFWIGVSCRLSADGQSLVGFDSPGMPLAGILDALLSYEPAVMNVMHSPVNAVARALTEVRSRWHGFVGAYPEIDEQAPAVSPNALATLGAGWVEQGARVIGGCCGTGPEYIRALKVLCAV